MTCPRCQYSVKQTLTTCPRCGLRVQRNVAGVMKTSAVLIACAQETGFYKSLQDVPEPLRTRVREMTNSANSGTILIADRAGKERLNEAFARREARLKAASAESAETPPAAPERARWIKWAAFVLVLALTAILAAIFGVRW